MTNYEVGQIIYTILEDKRIILPVQIIEQVVIKNLDGEETKYKVLLPNKKSQKVSIDRLDKIFNSIDEASNHLLENTKKAIDLMKKDAYILENEFFFNSLDNKINDENISHKEESYNKQEQKVKVSLPDGQVANINLSNIANHIENTNILDPQDKEEVQKKTWVKIFFY